MITLLLKPDCCQWNVAPPQGASETAGCSKKAVKKNWGIFTLVVSSLKEEQSWTAFLVSLNFSPSIFLCFFYLFFVCLFLFLSLSHSFHFSSFSLSVLVSSISFSLSLSIFSAVFLPFLSLFLYRRLGPTHDAQPHVVSGGAWAGEVCSCTKCSRDQLCVVPEKYWQEHVMWIALRGFHGNMSRDYLYLVLARTYHVSNFTWFSHHSSSPSIPFSTLLL